MSNADHVDRLRTICLEMPEATEKLTWETPTFRVRDKIFALVSGGPIGSEVWVKGRPGDQEMLIAAAPDKFFKPPYLGPKGWIGVRFNLETDWDEVADLVETSYRLIAPAKLIAKLDAVE